MWIILGNVLCALAKRASHRKLYFACRHSLRSDRPALFLRYWRSFE